MRRGFWGTERNARGSERLEGDGGGRGVDEDQRLGLPVGVEGEGTEISWDGDRGRRAGQTVVQVVWKRRGERSGDSFTFRVHDSLELRNGHQLLRS